MEKEPQPESLATVTIKPDYPPSEVYSSEPPPAYHRSQSSTVQVTKIAAVTVVLVSIILGSFWLASAYVQANASCKQLEEELALLSEAADRFQPPPPPFQPPQAEALVQNESQQQQKTEDIPKKSKDIDNNNIETTSDNSDSSSSESTSNESDDYEEKTPIKFKLPLQLDFDDLAGALIEKNQKSRMNCIVEKKRAEEVVDHQPKTLRLPFGLNLTTDPRYEHVSGERMAIFCESGNIQRNTPQQNDVDNNVIDDDNGDDSEEETIMIQPVMIPIPQSHFPTHMAHQMPQPQPIQYQQVHPMETMRPPMPPVMPQQQNQFPPNQILHHIAQQIVAQKIMEAQRAREQQYQQQQQQQEQEPEQNQEVQQEIAEPHIMPQRYPMMPQNIPLPEEVLTQLNRLPNRDVIVAVSEHDTDDDDNNQDEPNLQQQQQIRMMPQVVPQQPQQQQQQQQEVRMMPHEIRVVQEPRQSAAEMNGRQLYARGLPVHIPVHMIQQEQQQQQQQQQEPQAVASEETRPHYVQPRSLRSVDALLEKNQKRVKRCSCDCAC